ncbi:MAG: ribosome-associated translation inhibitor RaiA [Candidatus Omnitrophota bacterium]|jgi:putative sigma-54 modulation protein
MQVNITARHMELDSDLKAYINVKLSRLTKYNDSIEDVRVIFQKEKFFYIAEIAFIGRGFRIAAVEKDQALKASFDLCLTNAQKQLKKIRAKTKSRRIRDIFDGINVFNRQRRRLPKPKGDIVRIESFALKPMSVEEAALELEAFDKQFVVFHNATDNSVNVLYKRKNGDYGLIQP